MIWEIRKSNLLLLLDKYRTQTALGAATGVEQSTISGVLNDHRNVGHEVARRIEKALYLGEGWMDQEHTHVDRRMAGEEHHPLPVYTEAHVLAWCQEGGRPPSGSVRYMHCPIPCSSLSFVMRVGWPDMEPDLRPEDWVFADPERTPQHNNIVLAFSEDRIVLRQYCKINESVPAYLRRHNPITAVVLEDTTRITATIIFSGRILT